MPTNEELLSRFQAVRKRGDHGENDSVDGTEEGTRLRKRSLIKRARIALEQARKSRFDPDLLEWATLVQEYLERMEEE